MAQQVKSWSQLVSNESLQANPGVDGGNVPSESTMISLNDIMSEQLAVELTVPINSETITSDEQLAAILQQTAFDPLETGLVGTDCSNDEVLAKMLQRELDLEHDRMVKLEEKQYNANSKVKLSFENKRIVKDQDLSYSDLEDEETHHEYGEDSKHWDFFEKCEKKQVKIGRSGFTVNKGEVTTKHDGAINGAKNACKVMELESDIRTGDGGAFEMKLNNNVYNALKVYSISEGKRMARLHEKKEKSTAEKVLDEKSRILLFKLVNGEVLESINGVIATGKESVVFHAIGQNAEKGITMGEVAIKVFKTTITEFQNRIQYIVGDPVLEQAGKLSKQNPKLTIPLWAEKEMHNLNRMRKHGIDCPEVIHLKKHILLMTFIGSEGRPAPTLKSMIYTDDLLERIWPKTVNLMVKLYKDCDLIHADLSEYNLLWHDGKLWCIDVSQAVRTTHPMAYRFLWRDCVNICRFFTKKMRENKSPEELFNLITGKNVDNVENDVSSVELLDKIENYEKNEAKLKLDEGNQDKGSDGFNELFERGLKANVHLG